MKRWGIGLVILGLALPLTSFASHADEMEAELRSIRTQLELLEKREEGYRLQVEEMGKTVDRVSQQAAQGQADQKATLDQVRTRMELLEQKQQEVSQQQADLMTRLLSLQDKFDSELEAIKARLDRLDGGGRPAPQPVGLGNPPAAGGPATPADSREAYNLAVAQYRQKNYEAARAQFEAFLKAWPDQSLSGNAQFWIGECGYALAQYDKAALEYDKVRRNYPTNIKVPNATWKMALAFDQLGQRDAAKGFLKELIAKFPASPEADLARKKLAAWQ
jgi:tol-pal system protein YbgF